MHSPPSAAWDKLVRLVQQHSTESFELAGVHPTGFDVPATDLVGVCRALRDEAYFDFLSCISGIDKGPKDGSMEVMYQVYAVVEGYGLSLRVQIADRNKASLPSIGVVWAAAEWHEREAYDLLGIHFEGHPDLRRLFLPDDWVGHPLRKDDEPPATYHGIKVPY